jgi:hypothetical protein
MRIAVPVREVRIVHHVFVERIKNMAHLVNVHVRESDAVAEAARRIRSHGERASQSDRVGYVVSVGSPPADIVARIDHVRCEDPVGARFDARSVIEIMDPADVPPVRFDLESVHRLRYPDGIRVPVALDRLDRNGHLRVGFHDKILCHPVRLLLVLRETDRYIADRVAQLLLCPVLARPGALGEDGVDENRPDHEFGVLLHGPRDDLAGGARPWTVPEVRPVELLLDILGNAEDQIPEARAIRRHAALEYLALVHERAQHPVDDRIAHTGDELIG